MAPPRKPIFERLAANSKRDGECLIWTGNRSRDGYGVLTVGRAQRRAHRLSYAVAYGIIPEGMLVCHRCDRPLCIEPRHLFLGSPKANTADMMAKGRKASVTDSLHPNTKVSHADRAVIRSRRMDGQRLTEIAVDYGVSFQTISDICNGKGSYGTPTNR